MSVDDIKKDDNNSLSEKEFIEILLKQLNDWKTSGDVRGYIYDGDSIRIFPGKK